MARVLMLTQVLPYPPDAGPKVRQYYMLRHLAQQHEVTLVAFTRPDDRTEAIEHLRHCGARVKAVPIRRSQVQNVRAGIKGLATGLPITLVRDESAALADLLRQLVADNDFDMIHADQLAMSAHGLYAAQAARKSAASDRPGPRTLLDEHNAIYLLAQRMAATERRPLQRLVLTREAHAFERYEAATCRAYDAVLTVTEEDQAHLLALYGPVERAAMAAKFTVVPICSDPEQVPVVPRRPRARGEPPTILHLGTMFWPPNVNGVLWFAREVLPLVQAQVPEARFVIAGKNPPAEVLALTDDARIQVTGYVADPRPYLEQADAFIVPLHAGGGMRVKIIDAWQWGLPIVSTPIGAEGIAMEDGKNILIAGDAAGFASATARLLQDDDLNQRLRTEGRKWVEAHYAWQVVYKTVDAVYARLLQTARGNPD
jgi:polysaccharide biosynthesis protein PslH